MTLERRTPMKRGGPLRRTGGLTRGGPLAPSSAKRKAQAEDRARIRDAVFERDGQRCLLAGQPFAPPCLGRLTPHHLRKAGQGGPYTLANLVTLCAGHNDWLETAEGARRGRRVGLVILRGETHELAWHRLALADLVSYSWTGARIGP